MSNHRFMALIDQDRKALTEALLTGEISLVDGRTICEGPITEGDVFHLAGELLRWALSNNCLSLYLQALGSMDFHSVQQACDYLDCSEKHLMTLIKDGHIHASKLGEAPNSPLKLDVKSIKSYLNRDRVAAEKQARELVRRGGKG